MYMPLLMSTIANFDWLYYGRKNADVVAAFGWNETALKNHWTTNGQAEGRDHRFYDGIVRMSDFTGHNHSVADVVTGTFTPSQIPVLDASKITSGVFTAAQIPALAPASITTGIALARFPNFDASRIPDSIHEDRIKFTLGANGWEQIGSYIMAGRNGSINYGWGDLISGSNIFRACIQSRWIWMHNQGQNGTWVVVGHWTNNIDRRQVTLMMRVL